MKDYCKAACRGTLPFLCDATQITVIPAQAGIQVRSAADVITDQRSL
jgi:hypothetical protein